MPIYTLIFTEIKSRKMFKEWESKYVQCTIYDMPCYLKKKKCKYTYFSFSFFFFAAIKKMIIFVSSFVFYIKTVYISVFCKYA